MADRKKSAKNTRIRHSLSLTRGQIILAAKYNLQNISSENVDVL